MRINNRRTIALAIFFCSWSLFSLSINAQSNNTITGFVFTSDRRQLEGIKIELLDEFHRTLARDTTDRSGRYVFSRLSQGRYFLKALPMSTGFEEQTIEIEIVNIIQQSSESFQKDFYLREKNQSRPPLAKVGVVFAQDIPPAAKKFYEMAVDKLEDAKKQGEVTGDLIKAIEIFPDYYLALEKLAQHYVKLQNFNNAALVAAKAVEVNPKGYDSWYTLGYAYFQLKQANEAVLALKTAVELNPASVNALFLLGVNLRQTGKFPEAEESLLKAKKLAVTPIPEIHWQLALLYTNNLHRYADAVKELEYFLRANPNYTEVDKVKDLIKKLKAKEKA